MAHTLFDRFTNGIQRKCWRLAEAGNHAATLLVAALAGDDVATFALADAYREAGIEDVAEKIPEWIDSNRQKLATYHHNTRRAFFRACEKHGICTVQ